MHGSPRSLPAAACADSVTPTNNAAAAPENFISCFLLRNIPEVSEDCLEDEPKSSRVSASIRSTWLSCAGVSFEPRNEKLPDRGFCRDDQEDFGDRLTGYFHFRR